MQLPSVRLKPWEPPFYVNFKLSHFSMSNNLKKMLIASIQAVRERTYGSTEQLPNVRSTPENDSGIVSA